VECLQGEGWGAVDQHSGKLCTLGLTLHCPDHVTLPHPPTPTSTPHPQTYPTSQFVAFDDAMNTFLESNELNGIKPQAAALAVAGAVENNRCPMTNISWVIDGADLQRRFGFKCVCAGVGGVGWRWVGGSMCVVEGCTAAALWCGAVSAVCSPKTKVDTGEPKQTNHLCHTTTATATCNCMIPHPPPRVAVLNDFEAVGYGIPALGRDDVVAINPRAVPVPHVRIGWGGGGRV